MLRGRIARLRSAPARGGQAGMVTAELATGLPVLFFLVLVGLSALDLARARVVSADLAAATARQLARGAAAPAVADGATVRVVRGASTISVTVSMAPAAMVPFLSSIRVSETEVAALEQPQESG